MKLEKQVCSLELSQRLKEMGVKQESLFSYERYVIKEHNTGIPVIHYHNGKTQRMFQEHASNLYFVSAFTVAELGEMLPDGVISSRTKPDNQAVFSYWYCTHESYKVKPADTEADARAKMLVYLLENKLITL